MPSPPTPKLISWQSVDVLRRARTAPDAELTAEEAASTLFRFFRSKHVRDLRLIFSLAIFLVAIHVAIAVLVAIVVWIDERFFLQIDKNNPTADCLKFLIGYIGPALPIYGGIVAWAYLSASARLGIVDLFACEISTLCRVGTVVDIGKRYVEQEKAIFPGEHMTSRDRSATSVNFVSEENYFPVFTSNSKDLQTLEAMVVTHITEFYTFMKATRDSQRNLGEIKRSPDAKTASAISQAAATADTQCDALADVIFMMFLGYESARKAVKDLIEFEPTAAENTMVILITELECYCFLLEFFRKDQLRRSRLELRAREYKTMVPDLLNRVARSRTANNKDWERAWSTVPELERRYGKACLQVREVARFSDQLDAAE